MNEPKRRGRPPKARIEGADVVALPVVDAHIESIKLPLATSLAKIEAAQRDVSAAQAYALRVWNGQSPNVPRNERIRRVMAALNGQNLPTEGVELP
jgi:hypothetical protein